MLSERYARLRKVCYVVFGTIGLTVVVVVVNVLIVALAG